MAGRYGGWNGPICDAKQEKKTESEIGLCYGPKGLLLMASSCPLGLCSEVPFHRFRKQCLQPGTKGSET